MKKISIDQMDDSMHYGISALDSQFNLWQRAPIPD